MVGAVFPLPAAADPLYPSWHDRRRIGTMTAETPTEPVGDIDRIVLRPWPKVIFFYPTMLAAFIIGIWQHFDPGISETAGLVFFFIMSLNLLVIAFEFSRLKSVAIFFLLLAIFCFLLFLGTKVPVLDYVSQMLGGLHIQASTGFYLALGFYFV